MANCAHFHGRVSNWFVGGRAGYRKQFGSCSRNASIGLGPKERTLDRTDETEIDQSKAHCFWANLVLVCKPLNQEPLRERIKALAKDDGRYGYRPMTGRFTRESWDVGKDRVSTIWRQEGFHVPQAAHPGTPLVGQRLLYAQTAGAAQLCVVV